MSARVFDHLDLEIIDRVYEAILSRVEARRSSYADQANDEFQEMLCKRVMTCAANGKIEFDSLYEKVWTSLTDLSDLGQVDPPGCATGEQMPAFDPKLNVRVTGNDINITLLGTRYSVTYFKRRGSPGLFAKDIVHEDDQRVPMTSAEFLTKAWKIANERARELGWIV
jgi:hypothetical protein